MTITPPPFIIVRHTIDEYAKALLHIIVVVLAAVVVYLKSGNLTPTEYVNLGILLVTSIGVYCTPLVPNAKYQAIFKVGVAVAGAVLVSLNTFLLPGAVINSGAIITIILAAAAALGVGVIPNAPPSSAVYGYSGSSNVTHFNIAPPAPITPSDPITVPPSVPPTVV